jgi:site-specific recombinase XerD
MEDYLMQTMTTTYQQTAIEAVTGFDPIKNLVLDGLETEETRRAYDRALTDFLTWWVRQGSPQGRPPMTKAVVERYKGALLAEGKRARNVNQRLSAIRKLAGEAADNGLIAPHLAGGIARIKDVKVLGQRSGNWLNKAQAEILIDRPDTQTLRGKRDRAILATLIGTAIRRGEAAALTFDHVQKVDGHWAFVNIVGKHNRIRSVGVPDWAKSAIDEWAASARLAGGYVFRRIHRSGLVGECLTGQTINDVVRKYATLCGFKPAAHDLRRTWARLTVKGGASLRQIQLTLGHASIKTTELYIGIEQDFENPPCDFLGLEL